MRPPAGRPRGGASRYLRTCLDLTRPEEKSKKARPFVGAYFQCARSHEARKLCLRKTNGTLGESRSSPKRVRPSRLSYPCSARIRRSERTPLQGLPGSRPCPNRESPFRLRRLVRLFWWRPRVFRRQKPLLRGTRKRPGLRDGQKLRLSRELAPGGARTKPQESSELRNIPQSAVIWGLSSLTERDSRSPEWDKRKNWPQRRPGRFCSFLPRGSFAPAVIQQNEGRMTT